jgi:hypothetical protein
MQTSFASGELSPLLLGRTDLDQYYKGAQTAENVVIVPQGGVKRRPGTKFIDVMLKQLLRQTIINPTVGTNGGNPANLNDGNDNTYSIANANASATPKWLLAKYNLGVNPDEFEFIDVKNATILLNANTDNIAANIFIEWSEDQINWNEVGSFRINDTSQRTHRVKIDGLEKQYWRIVTDLVVQQGYSLRIGEFNLKQEILSGNTIADNTKTFGWEYAADQNYLCALTDKNLRFYRTPHNGSLETVYVADVIVPYEGSDIKDVKVTQTEGVMLMFHGDYPPQRIIFEGIDDPDGFTSGEVPFANVPEWDYDDKYSPVPVTCIQDILFSNFNKGETYQIDVQGVLSKNITFAGDNNSDPDANSATAFNLQRGLQDMPVFNDTGITVTRTAGNTYRIEIANESANRFELFSGFPTSSNAGSTDSIGFALIQQGSPRQEPVWSVKPDNWVAANDYIVGDKVFTVTGNWYSCIVAGTSAAAGFGPTGTGDAITDGTVTWKYVIERGYPKQGVFYEGRLWIGGVKPRQQSLFASRAGSFLDFYSIEGDDDNGIFITIDSRELTNIVDVNPDRGLQVFCAGAEFTITGLTPATIEVEAQTQHGSFNLEAQSIDGATLFVDKNGNTLRQYLYSFNEDAYTSNDLSVLSSQLINRPKDFAILSGTTTEDANWVFIINEDGNGCVLNTMRNQDINGFTRWSGINQGDTDGSGVIKKNTLHSCSAVGDEMYVVQSRANNTSFGSVDIEKWSFDYLLDSSYKVTVTAANPNADVFVPILEGARLEGYTISVNADGEVLADRPMTGSGVTITAAELNGFTTRDLEIGLKFPVKVKTMPLNTNPGTRGGQNTMKRKKITNINLRVHESAGIYIDGLAVPIRKIGETQDAPFNTPFTPRTGIIEDQNNGNGWGTEVVPEITVPDATPFHLQSIQYEVESS